MNEFDIENTTFDDLQKFKVILNIDVYWLPDNICLQYYRDIEKWVGLAALSANPKKAIVDQEVWEEKIGRKFDKGIQWYGATKLMDHLSRESLLVVVYIHSNLKNIVFKVLPDIPAKLAGKLGAFEQLIKKHEAKRHHWASLGKWNGPWHFQGQSFIGKAEKEEEDYILKWERRREEVTREIENHLRAYFLLKNDLNAAGLFFYVFSDPVDDWKIAYRGVKGAIKAAKLSTRFTFGIKVEEVTEKELVINLIHPLLPVVRQYLGLSLMREIREFQPTRTEAILLQGMMTRAIEIPKEQVIDEKIHIPNNRVSIKGERKILLGNVVKSVINREIAPTKVYFPIDILTSSMIIAAHTRQGKSTLAGYIANEVCKFNVRVIAIDPEGTLERLKKSSNFSVINLYGLDDEERNEKVREVLNRIYQEVRGWSETEKEHLKQLLIIDEPLLFRKCMPDIERIVTLLGKRGHGTILITQYLPLITQRPAARNVGSFIFLGTHEPNDLSRIQDIIKPYSKYADLIPALERGMGMVYSPSFYPQPFFVRFKRT